MKTLTTTAVLTMLGTGLLGAAEWPQWRGSNRDGRSPETGLLQSWPEAGPPMAWRASGLGGGFSSLAIAGGRIYTMGDLTGADHGDGQYALALNEKDGSLVWLTRIGPSWDDRYLGPRSTPTVDGNRLYLMNTEGDVISLDAGSGKEIWRRSLPEDFGSHQMQAMGTTDWKYAESPLVDGDRVLVTPGTTDVAMVALDKSNGEEIWRAPIGRLGSQGAYGAAYSSIVVSKGGGIKHYVQFIGRGLIGIEADTGNFLWGYNKVANDIANIATPLVHEDFVFASSGYGTGAALLQLSTDGEGGVKAEEVYFLEADTFQNHHGGLILHNGTVFSGTGHNKGFPIAVRFADGEVAWGPERNAGKNSAAITYGDGRIYFRYQDGLMVLIEATPEAYREHGSFMIPEVNNPSWSHPVISGGKLYLREQDNLFCYDISAP
ncbi:MAG: PQQ-like beta-propeller repeat protein [Acidobacteriota bacterium]|nr:PQQ-like beta-propeller repeat protein [Acidobacteriota bacterium]